MLCVPPNTNPLRALAQSLRDCSLLFITQLYITTHKHLYSNISVSLFSLQAIESFAVTVKDIAQMLQGFGSELAETELPDEGKAIEYLLDCHTTKYRKLKVRSQMFTYKIFHQF